MTAATTSDGAGRARRWLSRALAVAGGAVAATAAAWVVSTASAAASTEDVHLPDLRADKVSEVGKVGDALTGVAHESLPDQGESAEHGTSTGNSAPSERERFAFADGEAAAAKLKDSAQRFWDERVVKPVGDTLETVSGLVRAPEQPRDLGKDFWNLFQPGGGDLVGLPRLPGLPDGSAAGEAGTQHPAPAPGADTARPFAGAGQTGDAGHSARNRSADHGPDTSRDVAPVGMAHPAAQDDDHSAPEGPLRLPAPKPSALPTSTGGTIGGSHIDGPLFGLPAAGLAALHEAEAGAVRLGARHLPAQPGSQPGVTPD